MTDLERGPYKTDDESHDACPTCGTRLSTSANTDASGHNYHLECPNCSWTLPLERPPMATADDAQLITDGGVRAAGGPTDQTGTGTARDRLEAIDDDAADAVRAAIDGDGGRPQAADLRTVLEQSGGRIAYVVQHTCGIEYVYFAGGTIHARLRRGRDGAVLPRMVLDTDAVLARRARKRIDVIAYENVPAWVFGGDA